MNRLCNFLTEFRLRILLKPINRLVKQKKMITSSILVFRTKFPPNKKKYSLPVFSPSHQKNGEFTGCSSLCVERTNWWPKNYTFFRGQYLGPQILLKKCSILPRNIIFSMFMRTKSEISRLHIFWVVCQITTPLEIFLLEIHFQNHTLLNWNSFAKMHWRAMEC